MFYYAFYDRESQGMLKVAKTEDDGYVFAAAEYSELGSRSSFLVLDRGEAELLVCVLSDLLASPPTA